MASQVEGRSPVTEAGPTASARATVGKMVSDLSVSQTLAKPSCLWGQGAAAAWKGSEGVDLGSWGLWLTGQGAPSLKAFKL